MNPPPPHLAILLLLFACTPPRSEDARLHAPPSQSPPEAPNRAPSDEPEPAPDAASLETSDDAVSEPATECNPQDCHKKAMHWDLEGRLEDAFVLYADNCQQAYGASCYSIGDFAARCLYVADESFLGLAQSFLKSACDLRYSRGCFTSFSLGYPPDPAERPPWVPHRTQCNRVKAVLSSRVAPNFSTLDAPN